MSELNIYNGGHLGEDDPQIVDNEQQEILFPTGYDPDMQEKANDGWDDDPELTAQVMKKDKEKPAPHPTDEILLPTDHYCEYCD